MIKVISDCDRYPWQLWMADADANEEMFGFEFWSIVGSNIIFSNNLYFN